MARQPLTGFPHIALIATIALGTAQAWGGYAVDIRLLDRTTDTPTPYRTRLLLDDAAFNLDTTSLQGRPSAMIGRRDDALYLLDRRNRTFTSINLQALGGASALLKSAGAMLSSAGATAGATTVSATGRTRTIGGLPCRLYEVTRGGRKVQELWTTAWTHVPAPPTTLDLVRRVAAVWSGLAPILSAGAAQAPQIPMDALLQAEGFPVMFRQFVNGRVVYEGRFGAPQPVVAKPADFAVPANYRRQLPAAGAN